MAQLSLYLDDVAMEELRAAAASRGVSLSRYAASVLADAKRSGGYPKGFFKTYGALADVMLERPVDALEPAMAPIF